MKHITVHSLVCWLLLCVSFSGCQGPAPPKLVPVHGVVKYQKRPLSGATICFVPDFARGNHKERQATGQTAADGSFTLQTYPYGEGAMVGFYKVTCIVFSGVKPPRKYRDSTLTPLAIEVKEPGEEQLLLNLGD
jgi:hypothetical protein